MLTPLLERLANEGQGSFRLAKVNVDENPNLAIRLGVHGIPVVKAFRNSAMVAEFTGVQPEARLREFLKALAPSPVDLSIEKGASLLDLGRIEDAEDTFRDVVKATPNHPAGLLGLAKSLLLQGLSSEALPILERFPASHEYNAAQTLLPLARALVQLTRGEEFESEEPQDPAFYNALRLFKRGNNEAALDGLLDILRENKRYRNGIARQMVVAILELLGESNPTARQYRNELAAVLF